MAVFRREFRPYSGRTTPLWSRFLILPRYSFRRVFESKIFLALLLASLVWPLGCAVIIYLHFNLAALQLLELPPLISVDNRFFFNFMNVQSVMAFLLTVLAGPGLVSGDLTFNSLPLYFSRPFSRTDYVIGRMTVLVTLMSLVTWIPGLLLVSLQWGLAGNSWMTDHARVPAAIFLGSMIWILVLALLALALSAWVRWKPVAGALIFGTFFVSGGLGETINGLYNTRWGNLLNLSRLIESVWTRLFFAGNASPPVPPWSAWLSLLAICTICLLLLARKIRPCEVVR